MMTDTHRVPFEVATCRACGHVIQWIPAPSGGFWDHFIIPSDGHDPVTGP